MPDPRYPDTNQLPVSWNIIKAKYLFPEVIEKGYPDETMLSATQSQGVVPQDSLEQRVMSAFKGLENFKRVMPNDFVISLRSFQGGIEYSQYRGIISPAYTILRPKDFTITSYYRYYFKAWEFITRINAITVGIRDGKTIRYDEFAGMYIHVPPHNIASKIATFLDHETSHIDSLIEKKERLIELLKEKRQALITRAVTKGLDSTVKMKDSGVEWVGEIPEHWKLNKLKRVSTLFGRIGYRGYTTEDIVGEMEGAITLSPSNMVNGALDLEKCTYISWNKYHESPEIQVGAGDILIVKTGSTLGKVASVAIIQHPMTINPQLAIFKDIKADRRYLFHYLCSPYIQSQVDLSNTGGTIPTMTQETIGNYPFPTPPISEQHKIATFLDRGTTGIDLVINKIMIQIEKLHELRQTLISNAVTGKIDVREEASA